MNKSKKLSLLVLLILFLFSSCSSIANMAGLSMMVAGSVGVVDKNIANSITNAAFSVGKAAEVVTPEAEYIIGRQVAAQLLGRYPLQENPEATKYLNSICQAIVINSEKPTLYKGYHVGILNSNEINAFATSGGHILVTKGLLKCVNSEDALAAVIAHEVAHIQLEHNIKAIQSNRNTSAIFDTLSATTVTLANGSSDAMELTKTLDSTVNEAISVMITSGYSVSQEYDADKMALKLMSDAGYDCNAMNDMLVLLEEEYGKAKIKSRGFIKTHPEPKKRIKKLKKEYKKLPVYSSKESRIERFNANKEYL